MNVKLNKSMTIVELLIVATLGTVVLASVLPMWIFTYKTWSVENIRTKLRVNLEIGTENIKNDIRLSSATHMRYYPQGAGPYSAISFPNALRDQNGFYNLDADEKIIWDQTIIYHVYTVPETEDTELRKTVFDPRDNSLSATERYTQLSNVVDDGDGDDASTPNNGNSVTTAIFENPVQLSISPSAQEFDGYSSAFKISDNTGFGSILLDPGYHEVRFEVTGKNDASTGYKIGLDGISISPSGGLREAEFYIPPHASSGDSATEVYDEECSGYNYLKYASNAVGDFVTLRMYYDLWRESNFANSIRENTIISGNDLVIELPTLEEGSEIDWTAEVEAGSNNGDAEKADYDDATPAPILINNVTIRCLVSSANLDSGGDLVRVKFCPHSLNTLTITSAYLNEMVQGTNDCVIPTTSDNRIRLYFTDSIGGISCGITIASGDDNAYSNWAIFPIDPDKSYFVTFNVSGGYASYWAGTEPTHDNSYLIDSALTDYSDIAVWPDPTRRASLSMPAEDESISSPDIIAVALLEVWSKEGSVDTEVYDTKLASPSYNNINWSEYKPFGSSVVVKARSSSDEFMAGAADWDTMSDSTINGSARYLQYRADLSATPYWTCVDHGGVVSDASYKVEIPGDSNKKCPTCLKYLVPFVNCPWVDNIAVDWEGNTSICEIAGYMAQDSDYGVFKVTVDGTELIKGLNIQMTLQEDFQDNTYEATLTQESEPRNTGR